MSYVHKRFKVETIPVVKPDRGEITYKPFVRISVDGRGCSIQGCNCSSDNFISVSDGKTILKIDLTASQAEAIRGGVLYLGEA